MFYDNGLDFLLTDLGDGDVTLIGASLREPLGLNLGGLDELDPCVVILVEGGKTIG